ncbi:hypothetical protein [Sulfurovum sp. TSL6]|uniref:hypothetical protein n=1 Tax=Sulfurovum sp. TSL6 TaxID=2826995 RepID=UPI001CC71917|nr:hypothetical protein [Sulfurovum sp. TSL6]
MRRIGRHTRFKRFINDIIVHTLFIKMILLLIVLWLIFSAGLYLAEQGVEGASIDSYGEAFSTAGIADTPTSSTAQFVGGLWIVIGSIFFLERL